MKISLPQVVGTLALACLAAPTLGAKYSRSDSIVGPEFLTAFEFEAEADPTHGRVLVSFNIVYSLDLLF